MKTYLVELINKNKDLDLIHYSNQINNCLTVILNMEKGLMNFDNLKISKSFFLITVEEKDKWWHQTFGKLLANDYGMRQFCFEDNPSKLFNWSL